MKNIGLPLRLFAFAVQVVAEKRRFDVLAEFRGCVVAREWNLADAIGFVGLPLAVEPRSGNDEVSAIGIMFGGMPENLPGPPGVFLIPEPGDIEIRHRGCVKLAHPRLLLPEIVIVGMIDGRIPVWNLPVQIFVVEIRKRAEIQIPLVGVVRFEREMGVAVLVGLLHHRVFEIVAFAQSAVTMIIVVHPLIDGRSLLAHRFQRSMRMQQRKRGRKTVVGDAHHADFSVVVRDVFDQPIDGIVGVSRFVGGFRVSEIDPGCKIEFAFGAESPAEILDHINVAVLFELDQRPRYLFRRFFGDAVGSATKQNRQRAGFVGGSEDNRLRGERRPGQGS